MKNEQNTVFYNAMMTGLFVGIMDTVIILTYNVFYRNYTGYFPSEVINVSSIIFMVNLLLLLIGLLFYIFHKNLKGGDGIFLVFILVITALLAWKLFGSHRFPDARINQGYHGLLGGIIIIMGISAACIPLLFNNKKFLDACI
jgi:hypothetical protein